MVTTDATVPIVIPIISKFDSEFAPGVSGGGELFDGLGDVVSGVGEIERGVGVNDVVGEFTGGFCPGQGTPEKHVSPLLHSPSNPLGHRFVHFFASEKPLPQ